MSWIRWLTVLVGAVVVKHGLDGLSTTMSVFYLIIDAVAPGVGTLARLFMEGMTLLGIVLLAWALYPLARTNRNVQPPSRSIASATARPGSKLASSGRWTRAQ